MAEEVQFSRADNKRKFDDPGSAPPSSAGAPATRRPTGFSAPISSPSPDNSSAAAPPSSYNSVPPPPVGIQLAKQRAQEIAARLFSETEAKRPKVENGGGADDSSNKGSTPSPADHLLKFAAQLLPSQTGLASAATFPTYGYLGTSKKVEVPNGRVGVIIGKGGETIKNLQMQSGAKIQVTRDNEADPYSQSRSVELTGTPDQISRAEQLIKDVLEEAESSGIGNARRSGGFQVGGEQFTMQVPNDKVGLIIGKGGETIKSMQAKTGARIQLIPLHPPPGDTSTERIVQIDGTTEQIESAKQLINEVTSATRFRNPQMSGGYSQQGYRPPRPPTSWGTPGQAPMQQAGYGYMQPGSYPGAPPQYNMSQPPYGGYPSAPAPAPAAASGWDQSSNASAQQTTPAAGYDYYNQQQQASDNTSYNYGHNASYGSQGSYADASGQQAGYGQQDNYSGSYQAPTPQQPGGYSQSTSTPQSGYDNQQGYNSSQSYGSVTNPAQDGSTAAYGVQSTPASQVQPSSQPGSTAAVTYAPQGTAQAGYGIPPASQPGYGGYPTQQPSYGQPQQAQKPTGQAASAAAYTQPAPAQTGYQMPPSQPASGYTQPSSGYAAGGGIQPGYGQQQPTYSGSQQGYGQQQQSYGDSYGSGGYSQPASYSADNADKSAS